MIDLLPPNATKQERALSSSIARLSTVPVPMRDLWNADTCPASLLPWLAWALNVDSWDSNWTDQQKRNVIKSSVDVHRHKGTVGAVRRIVDALGVGAVLQEWWEEYATIQTSGGFQLVTNTGVPLVVQQGAPYTAAITIASTDVSASVQDGLLAAIERVKPVRTLITVQNVNGFQGTINATGALNITLFDRIEATANYVPQTIVASSGAQLVTDTGAILTV
jgi:phage tail P2-like protein